MKGKSLNDTRFSSRISFASKAHQASSHITLSGGSRAGCTLVPSLSWKTAPLDAYIIGLKELPENDNCPLAHTHIFFTHCYKNQAGWQYIIRRFIEGGGTILDLEYLNDERGESTKKRKGLGRKGARM